MSCPASSAVPTTWPLRPFEKPTLMGSSTKKTLAFSFHEYGFGLVSLTDLGLSFTVHGPSSMKRPMDDEQPGPPLIHMMTGSFLGLLRDSKK